MASSYDTEEKGEPQNSSLNSPYSSSPNPPSSIPSFLRFMRNAFTKNGGARVERFTRPPAMQTSNTINPGQQQPTFQASSHPHDHDAPVPARDKLATFRRITGITSGHEHRDEQRPATNLGIYARVVQNEKQALDAFKISSRLINGCLALQLIVAASLTALGWQRPPRCCHRIWSDEYYHRWLSDLP